MTVQLEAMGTCLVCRSTAFARCSLCGAWCCDHVCAITHAMTSHAVATSRRTRRRPAARRMVRA